MVDVQWAVIMAEVVFKLIHPKDSLCLDTIGISLDTRNEKIPLFCRIAKEVGSSRAYFNIGLDFNIVFLR